LGKVKGSKGKHRCVKALREKVKNVSFLFTFVKLHTMDVKLAKELFPVRDKNSRKGNNGKALVVGGSWLYHGAPVLSSLAAQRTGVDLLYLAVPKPLVPSIRAISPDLIVFPLPDLKFTKGSARRLLKRLPEVDSVLLGPGMGKRAVEGLKTFLQGDLDEGIRFVLDADALRHELLPFVRGKAIITPHAGEFKRLFDVDLSEFKLEERAEKVKEKAKEYDLTILLKGRVDVISDGSKVFLNRTGNSGMSVGGTGDVLAGIALAFLSRGLKPLHAASLAAFFNGLAGDRARERYGFHFTAKMMLEEIPSVMKDFDVEVE
jgi:NAD(P)H-hydrate epimerase